MKDIRGNQWYREYCDYIYRKALDIIKNDEVEYVEVPPIHFSRRGKNIIKVSYPTHLGQKSENIVLPLRDDD